MSPAGATATTSEPATAAKSAKATSPTEAAAAESPATPSAARMAARGHGEDERQYASAASAVPSPSASPMRPAACVGEDGHHHEKDDEEDERWNSAGFRLAVLHGRGRHERRIETELELVGEP